jgi:hypothetical protein
LKRVVVVAALEDYLKVRGFWLPAESGWRRMSKSIDKHTAPLADLAVQINAEHRQFEDAISSSLANARKAGELLPQAKGQLRHGKWLLWLRENRQVTPRTAQRYMLVASRWEELVGKCDTVSHLTFQQTVRLLTTPSGQEGGASPGGLLLVLRQFAG